MSTSPLRKTLLAIAISASATPALAVNPVLNEDISGSTYPTYELGSYDSATLIGNANRAPNNDGVIFAGVNIAGNLTNIANITASGPLATALGLSRSFDMSSTPTTIGGDLINNSNIAVTGAGVAAISTGHATIGGSLLNNGSIAIAGVTDPSVTLFPQAIFLYDTKIGGDLANNGSINVSGENAQGIVATSVDGATGSDRASIGKDVVNKGSLSVNGKNAVGILMNNIADLNAINNAGSISALGDNATAIQAFDSLGTAAPTATNGIVNTGSIFATDTAISVNNTQGQGDVVIRQNGGTIEGGNTSISGNNHAQLVWNAGTITGNMKGMNLVKVLGSGTFNGAEIDAVLVDVNSGTLYMASDSSRMTGDLAVQKDGTLQVRLRDVTSTITPVVSVAGKATFAAGSKIGVTATPGDFTSASAGKTYTLVKAGSIEDNGLTVVSNSALLNLSNFKVDGQTVTATVNGKTGADAAAEIRKFGASNNAASALTPFTDSVMGQLNANDPVFSAFANANGAELAKLAEQLAPVVNGGTTHAAAAGQGMISSALSSRSEQVRGESSGDVLSDTGLWVRGLYSDADMDTRNGVAGYSAYTSGFILGADGKLSPSTTVGVALSHLDTTVNADNSNTDVATNALTAYGTWTQGPIFVDASVTYGKSDNESKRTIATTTAKGDYDSDMLGLNVLGGYTFNLKDGLVVEPRAALRYTDLQIDSYSEKGSSAALNVGSQRLQIGELGAGARVAKDFPMGNGTLKPQATLMAYHDFIGDKSNSTSTFILGGSPFVASGATQARNSYELGLGIDYSIGAVTVGASYNYIEKTDFNADTFMLRGRYDF